MLETLTPLLSPINFFLSYNERVYWLYLLTSFTMAFAVLLFYKPVESERSIIDFKVLKKILLHPSACDDYAFFYANVLLQKTFIFGWLSALTFVVSNQVQFWLLDHLPNWQGILTEKSLFFAFFFTLLVALVTDFAIFLGHYLQHKLPLLWEFHKVHHSARVLTPITLYRMHPVDDMLNFSLGGFLSGSVMALILFLTSGKLTIYNVAGSNLIFILFYLFGYHLRHSHVWLSYGKFWSKIFISPAQHQIHHSANPLHFDKNMGLLFAFWDAWFGTLYIPKIKEDLVFGLGDATEDKKFSNFWSLYLMPFINVGTNFRLSMLLEPKRYLSPLLFSVIVLGALYLNQQAKQTVTLPKQVYMEEMTWQEIQQALNNGTNRVIVPTGGTEQNGPHLVLGKHNFIVKYTAGKIAEQLGHTLVTPVLSYVPEGNISPPEGHMLFAGTLSVSELIFAQTLEQTAQSLKQHGFKTVIFIGDSGGNQAMQQQVANKLNALWQTEGVKVIQVIDYYSDNNQTSYLNTNGFSNLEIGHHAGIRDTSELLAVYPPGVRTGLLNDHSKTDFNQVGADGDASKASIVIGQALLGLKINAALKQIKAELNISP